MKLLSINFWKTVVLFCSGCLLSGKSLETFNHQRILFNLKKIGILREFRPESGKSFIWQKISLLKKKKIGGVAIKTLLEMLRPLYFLRLLFTQAETCLSKDEKNITIWNLVESIISFFANILFVLSLGHYFNASFSKVSIFNGRYLKFLFWLKWSPN